MTMPNAQYKERAPGLIPPDWDVRPLGECAFITMGQSPAGATYNRLGVGVPLLNGPTEFTGKYPGKVQWTSAPTKICQAGDILICVRGSSTGRMNIANDAYCLGRGLASIRHRAGIEQAFLVQVLQYSVSALLKSAAGSTFPSIDAKAIAAIQVPMPTVKEQRHIAGMLNAVDDKIAIVGLQLIRLQVLKRQILRILFSDRVVHHGADWQTMALFALAEVRTGVAKGKKGLKNPISVPYLRVANVQDGHLDLREIKTIEVEASQIERYALQAGDILMTEGGDFDKLGRGDVWRGQLPLCLHQNHVFAVRPDPIKLNSDYLAIYAASEAGRKYFLGCSKRTTNLASINSSQLQTS